MLTASAGVLHLAGTGALFWKLAARPQDPDTVILVAFRGVHAGHSEAL